MPSIQSSPHPMIFKVQKDLFLPEIPHGDSDKIAMRTVTRALEGMQKEAVVNDMFTNTAWRMVCDEGPWLNGSDLASFPLGYFSGGMIATLASEILALARQRDIQIDDIKLVQDARYTMEGSAIKRTMTGSALPLETEVSIKSNASQDEIEKLAYHALAASPADAIMRSSLPSLFKVSRNGHELEMDDSKRSSMTDSEDPSALFDQIKPVDEAQYAKNITQKLEGVETGGEKQGTAVGYATEQKRMVQVRAVLTLREDGVKVVQVQCIKPEGSTFEFLSDDPVIYGGQDRAPTGLQYLSAGLSFCFMTQLGRFAGIVKQDLSGYGIVQDTIFGLPGASAGLNEEAKAYPIHTHTFLQSKDDDEAARLLVEMGEQTCYLHACYRGEAKTRLRIIN